MYKQFQRGCLAHRPLVAVTIERPGGVVVSDCTRIAALADTI